MGNTMIHVKELDYKAGDTQILDKISLYVEKNEFVGLIGPNGSGKSTLLKNIYRHFMPEKQTVYLNGKDIVQMGTKEVAKQMSVVAQENQPDFDFSVLEMVMMGRYAHKKIFEKDNAGDLAVCRDALKVVGMEGMEKRSFLSLSGGEKQRIYIAMAFAQESELIILDEPTNHLDIGYQLAMMETMKARKDVTIFTSVHDINLAAWYCDRIILLNKGHVVAEGTPEEVLTPENIRDIFHVNVNVRKRERDRKLQVEYLEFIPAQQGCWE